MFSEFSAVINQLYALHDESIVILREVIEERVDNASAERSTTLTIIGVLFLISLSIGFVIVRSITSSASTLIQAFSKISHQDYSSEFNTKRKDEMGIIEKSLAELTAELKEAAIVAIEASKVKQALDSSSMCFMMSNADREIVYMNESVKKLMKESEAAIKKDLPQFDADTLIGTRIDSFHHNPKHQHAVLDQLTKTHEARLDLGGKSFKLNINPIRDEKGNDLGNSVEWLDMTEIFEEEKRVKRVLEALDSSSTNIMIANAEREVIYMNRSMVDTMEEAESDLRKVLPQFRAGDIMGKSMDRFHANPNHQMGILEGLKDTLISEIKVGRRHFKLTANPIYAENGDRIGTVVEWLDRTKEVNAEIEINDMVTASLRGDFTKRIDESDKEGFLKIVSEGLNELIKTTESGLNEVSNVLLAISQGDLTKRITSDYQGTFNDLKNYTNSTTENLVSVISKIREASDTINNASSEIAQGNADLSTRTEQQASSLEETASSMEEITSTVRLNAENANQANGLASQASQVASNGGDLIQEVVVTMSSINESSQKIADIIGVIDGIAFQTNILALNAAVEAARAGEQGRGFAVVASEVRTLAQRSANAAKDIKDLISDSVSKVESGNSLVNQSGETMKEIVTAIQRVNDIMSEIAAASAEQASGIDEVSKAVTQMDEMTQQNAALVEEAAAAAESMRTQASELTGRVGTFKLNESDAPAAMNVESAPRAASPAPTMSQSADPLSQQFAELPSVMSSPKGGNNNEDDEWESF
jgi:methyl-accepting chemotaxis protein